MNYRDGDGVRYYWIPMTVELGAADVVVVVVVATWEEWKFPILAYSKGRSACQRSYADPPFEAPLSGSIVTHPSTLPTLPSS